MVSIPFFLGTVWCLFNLQSKAKSISVLMSRPTVCAIVLMLRCRL